MSSASGTSSPRIPDYELIRKIGSGSYGDVWLARGLTGAFRAVKIVWRDRFSDAGPFEREFRGLKEFTALSFEASQMALLHVGQDERAGFFYYVMELADDAATGRTIDPARYVPLTAKELKARRGRLPAAECVAFGVELARSLAGLHGRNLLHRDIKPSNVIVVAGVPKLADIGLVASSTDARTFVGTEGYVPPEGPGAPGADVFALGKVLYELATGLDRTEFPKLPDDLGEASEQRALFQLNEVLLRACDSTPGQRYRDAAAMLADLGALQAGRSVRRGRRWPYAALAAAVVVIGASVYFGGGAAKKEPSPVAAPATPTPVAKSQPRGIAVLPFENLGAADQAYFAVGVTEDVTQQLAKIHALRVMSRQAVARFGGGAADLPAMTRELGIGAILTGSVQHAGEQVRIRVQLLAAPSGETLWSEQYNGELKDIFRLQSDVALRVTRSLQAALAPDERARIERVPTENAAAYELYLKAGSKPQHPEAIELLKQAVALDPQFALAHSFLSWRYLRQSYRSGRDDINRALETARTAVALDPQVARAHHVLGNALGLLGQTDAARLALQRSIELDSNAASALLDLSTLEMNSGRVDQAFYWAKRAFPLAPNIGYTHYHVAGALLVLDEASAERWLRAGIARFPANDATGVHRLETMLAYLELYHGQPAAALERMRKLAAARPTNPECTAGLTEFAVFTGAADAVDRVDQALKEGPDGRPSYSGYTPRTMRAFLWVKSGDRERAQPLIAAALAANRAALEGGDRSTNPLYENAALHVLRGDHAAALDSLEAARVAGVVDAAFIKADPLLAPLAKDPRFIQLVDRIARDLREMRARVDLGELDELIGVGQPAPKTVSAPAVPPTTDKSVVVLPLENLSPDPANAFFTEGIHADIIAAVGRVSGLKVISRNAALHFKDSKASLAEIARTLGVAHVVTGSVRREGHQVRILLELRRASDDALLWSPTYDRELQNVLGLQREIAGEVARVLQARQMTGLAASARLYSTDPQAYDLFLKALKTYWAPEGQTLANMDQSCELFSAIVQRDPKFAWAVYFLSTAHAQGWEFGGDPVARAAHAQEAKRWAEAATLLDAALGDAAMSYYLTRIEGDPVRGFELAQRAASLLPNESVVHLLAGLALERLGRWPEAIEAYGRANEIDPFELRALYNRMAALTALRRAGEFEPLVERYVAAGGGARPGHAVEMAAFRYELRGEIPADLKGFLPNAQVTFLLRARRWDEARRVAETALADPKLGEARRCDFLRGQAEALRQLGRGPEADGAATAALELAEKLGAANPGTPAARLIFALSVAGRTDEAIAAARRLVQEESGKAYPTARWSLEQLLARILARGGRTRESVALIKQHLALPGRLTVPMLRAEWDWDSLRDDAEFKALLADPKNSGPL